MCKGSSKLSDGFNSSQQLSLQLKMKTWVQTPEATKIDWKNESAIINNSAALKNESAIINKSAALTNDFSSFKLYQKHR
jgi:hypothetical protein